MARRRRPGLFVVEAFVLSLWITCIVVLPVLALVFYVVHRSKLRRFRLSAKVLKLLDISIEVDAQDKPDEPPATTMDAAERSSELPSPGSLRSGQ